MGNLIFANRVKKIRTDSNLTMEEMASRIGVTKSRVNMWENNGAVPRQDALTKIATEFSVSIDYLLGNDSEDAVMKENPTLQYLQRGLKKLDEKELKKAEAVLEALFDDAFNEKEKHAGI